MMKTYEFYIRKPEKVKVKAENLEKAINQISHYKIYENSPIIIDNKELTDKDGDEIWFSDIPPSEYHLY